MYQRWNGGKMIWGQQTMKRETKSNLLEHPHCITWPGSILSFWGNTLFHIAQMQMAIFIPNVTFTKESFQIWTHCWNECHVEFGKYVRNRKHDNNTMLTIWCMKKTCLYSISYIPLSSPLFLFFKLLLLYQSMCFCKRQCIEWLLNSCACITMCCLQQQSR